MSFYWSRINDRRLFVIIFTAMDKKEVYKMEIGDTEW